MNVDVNLEITEEALKEFKNAIEQSELKDVLVRVSVQGGGCSGFVYGLGFVERNEADPDKDFVEKRGDVEIVVDKKSMLFLDGVKIDWISDLSQRGFKFINPNATKTCGCGKSFQ
jgi:iron-sulfur cluster assembly protein